MNEVLEGKVCPYCGKESDYVDSREIYGRSYGMVYICRPCNAYCGVHKGTDKALGRLANAELREMKKAAHRVFDALWKDGILKRGAAYKWLATELGLPIEITHIGMFDVDQCKKVIQLCNEKIRS